MLLASGFAMADAVIELGVDTTQENPTYDVASGVGYTIKITGSEIAIANPDLTSIPIPADNVIDAGGKTITIIGTDTQDGGLSMTSLVANSFGVTIKGGLDFQFEGGRLKASKGIVAVNEEGFGKPVYLTIEGDMNTTVANMNMSRSKYGVSYGVGIMEGDFTVKGEFTLNMSNVSDWDSSATSEAPEAQLHGLGLGGGASNDEKTATRYTFEKSLYIGQVEHVYNKNEAKVTDLMSSVGVSVSPAAYVIHFPNWDYEEFEVPRIMEVKENLTVENVTVKADAASAEAYGLDVDGAETTVTVNGATKISNITATIEDAKTAKENGKYTWAAGIEAGLGAKVDLLGSVTVEGVSATGGKDNDAFALVAFNGATININDEKSDDKTVILQGGTKPLKDDAKQEDIDAKMTRIHIDGSDAAININLCNSSSVFYGYTTTGENIEDSSAINIHLGNGATWYLPADNHLQGALTMQGNPESGSRGIVEMTKYRRTPEAFTTLTVDKLAGEGGIFHMSVDTEQSKADQLVIGNGTGAHYLAFENKAGNAGKEDILVVTQQSGDASFLQANEVTVGNYSYTLRTDTLEDGSSLTYLTPTALSSSTLASLSMASLGAQCSAYLSSVGNLRSRMGEVRGRTGSGLWGQMHFWKDRADSYGGTSLSQDVMALSAGYDVMPNDKWIVGAGISAATHDQTGMECVGRVSGDADSFFINPYGTWMHDNGTYVDIVGAAGVYDQDFQLYRPGQTGMSGSYTDFGVGISVEVGRKYSQGTRRAADGKGSFGDEDSAHGWFVEPQAQLSFYAIFADDYKTSEGSSAKRDDATFLTGRIGVVAGKDFTFGNSKTGQIYAKAGFIHEFCGNQHVIFNGERFSEDSILGSRFYYGIGGEMELHGNLRAYGEIGREEGAHYTREYDARFGIKFSY